MKTFKLPFIGIDVVEEKYTLLYHNEGHYSVVIRCSTPIVQYSGDAELYYQFHHTISSIIKNLGSNYIFQKHDIFKRNIFCTKAETEDYLQEKHLQNFQGREVKKIDTYITITKIVSNKLLTFNEKDYDQFIKIIEKTIGILESHAFAPSMLEEEEINEVIKRYVSMNFNTECYSLDNIKANKEELIINDNHVRSISLMDTEEVSLPNEICPITSVNVGYKFPKDILSFLAEIDEYDTIIYHQVLHVPDQKEEIRKLDAKKRRHSSMKGAINDKAIADIENVEKKIAEENQIVVYAHCNIIISAKKQYIQGVCNNVESALFNFGVVPCRNSYNQLELFRSGIFGNATELKEYDFFWTTSDPAICFLYKEKFHSSEDTNLEVYVTNRQGAPICIDPSDMPMQKGRIVNRNKFILGPSGSGKSFFMNHLLRQYALQNTDIVIVDTGHSYSGLCSYYEGRYITYSEESPITMNPFNITHEEYNEEKREFLKSLIGVLWKGTQVALNQVEDTAITKCIYEYYDLYFSEKTNINRADFNSFYEFSVPYLDSLRKKENVTFDISSYKFILRKFYEGGEYDIILNSSMDKTLFDEKFVVFEIDAIKDHKILFPITTLIIMDVFIQKMRLKKNRKVLVIEEAWKAIASPTMASYILYMYKTVRKFWGEAMVVTQELEDIIGNEVVKNSIINNSDSIILLDQSKFKDNYNEIAALLSLSTIERNKIFTINNLNNKENRGKFKEVYIRRGGEGEVYGIEVSLHEYLTFTTERREKDAVQVYLKQHSSYREGLEAFIDDFKKSGLSLDHFVTKTNTEVNIF